MGFYKRFFRFKPMMWSKMYTNATDKTFSFCY